MKGRDIMFLVAVCVSLVLVGQVRCEEAAKRPVIDVVFCLDSTGSMSGEIKAAKDKIWTIANGILEGKPRPLVRFGVVAYRDKGDEYVTRKSDLSDDIDSVHEFLTEIKAAGGGDGPEDVREALRVSVHEMSWSKGGDALKLVFLVGDAEPHRDYPERPTCSRTASAAAEKGININTLACGTMNATGVAVWKRVAELSDGSFQQLPRPKGGGSGRRMMMEECMPSACAGCSSPCDSEMLAEEAPSGPAPAAAADAFKDAILDTVKKKAAGRGMKFE